MRILAIALAALAASCAPNVDADEGEQAISEWLSQQLGIETDEVSCPSDVKRSKGKTFKCSAKAEGGELVVRVTQTDDEGHIRFGTSDVEGIVVSARLEDQLEQAFLEREEMDVTVDCGRRHRVAVPGTTFFCEAENRDGDEAPIEITVEDRVGNVSYRLDR